MNMDDVYAQAPWLGLPPSRVEELLSQDDVSLEAVLNEDEVVQECRSLNQELIDFLTRPDNLRRLVEFIIAPISQSAEQKNNNNNSNSNSNNGSKWSLSSAHSPWTFASAEAKFAYVCSEIFACECDSVLDALLASDELMDLFMSFLDQPPPLDPVSAAHFYKVFTRLLHSRYEATIRYMRRQTNLVANMVRHIGLYAMVELITVIWTDGKHYRSCIQWFDSCDLVPLLVAQLDPSRSRDHSTVENAAQTLIHIVQKIPELLHPMHRHQLSEQFAARLPMQAPMSPGGLPDGAAADGMAAPNSPSPVASAAASSQSSSNLDMEMSTDRMVNIYTHAMHQAEQQSYKRFRFHKSKLVERLESTSMVEHLFHHMFPDGPKSSSSSSSWPSSSSSSSLALASSASTSSLPSDSSESEEAGEEERKSDDSKENQKHVLRVITALVSKNPRHQNSIDEDDSDDSDTDSDDSDMSHNREGRRSSSSSSMPSLPSQLRRSKSAQLRKLPPILQMAHKYLPRIVELLRFTGDERRFVKRANAAIAKNAGKMPPKSFGTFTSPQRRSKARQRVTKVTTTHETMWKGITDGDSDSDSDSKSTPLLRTRKASSSTTIVVTNSVQSSSSSSSSSSSLSGATTASSSSSSSSSSTTTTDSTARLSQTPTKAHSSSSTTTRTTSKQQDDKTTPPNKNKPRLHATLNPRRDSKRNLKVDVKPVRVRVGEMRMKAVELIVGLVVTDYEPVHEELARLRVLPHMLDMFFAFPQHNLLHKRVEDIVYQVLSLRSGPLTKSLFGDGQLVKRMLNAHSSNYNDVTSGGQRAGYMGHVVRMCNKLLERADDPVLREYLGDNREWSQCAKQWLSLENAKLQFQLGGVDPHQGHVEKPFADFTRIFDDLKSGGLLTGFAQSQDPSDGDGDDRGTLLPSPPLHGDSGGRAESPMDSFMASLSAGVMPTPLLNNNSSNNVRQHSSRAAVLPSSTSGGAAASELDEGSAANALMLLQSNSNNRSSMSKGDNSLATSSSLASLDARAMQEWMEMNNLSEEEAAKALAEAQQQNNTSVEFDESMAAGAFSLADFASMSPLSPQQKRDLERGSRHVDDATVAASTTRSSDNNNDNDNNNKNDEAAEEHEEEQEESDLNSSVTSNSSWSSVDYPTSSARYSMPSKSFSMSSLNNSFSSYGSSPGSSSSASSQRRRGYSAINSHQHQQQQQQQVSRRRRSPKMKSQDFDFGRYSDDDIEAEQRKRRRRARLRKKRLQLMQRKNQTIPGYDMESDSEDDSIIDSFMQKHGLLPTGSSNTNNDDGGGDNNGGGGDDDNGDGDDDNGDGDEQRNETARGQSEPDVTPPADESAEGVKSDEADPAIGNGEGVSEADIERMMADRRRKHQQQQQQQRQEQLDEEQREHTIARPTQRSPASSLMMMMALARGDDASGDHMNLMSGSSTSNDGSGGGGDDDDDPFASMFAPPSN